MRFIQSATISIILLTLSACAYQPEIKQGVELSTTKLDQIKPGMSKVSLTQLLGKPTLNQLSDEDTWIYVYRKQHKRQVNQKLVHVYFNRGKVTKVTETVII